MGKSIIVFTLKDCEHCLNLIQKLDEISIPYQEIEINQNKTIWEQVVSQTGYNVLPTVFIKEENNENGLVYIPSRDYENQEEIVEIIKSHI